MEKEKQADLHLEIAHVLFLDIVATRNSPLTSSTPELMNSTALFAWPSNSKKLKRLIDS